MSIEGQDELHLAEEPALRLLGRLGYRVLTPAEVEAARESSSSAILVRRLAAKLRELNEDAADPSRPPLTDAQLARVLRAVTAPEAIGLIEVNQQLHTLIAHGMSVEHHFGELRGQQGRDIRLIDYEHRERNEFAVARQFVVRGARRRVVADLVVFVNGLPLAVIECKSPHLADPISEAVRQLERYQEAGEDFLGQGAPALFHTAQVLVATCGTRSRCGTVLTPARFYAAWRDAWPLTDGELCDLTGRDTADQLNEQERLLCGLFRRETLLEMARTFVAFETEHGRTVKKLARYQQFRAVGRAVKRIRSALTPGQRGGVVWHTQGSGKSLTMLWLAVSLRRAPDLKNPLLVIVTDRVDLDRQIAATFAHCGFPNPEPADSAAKLRSLLTTGSGRTVLTTLQKFGDRATDEPAWSTERDVYVLVDEAHRSQYRELAARMRAALPGACFLGFTGTPIDKRDRSTPRVFGTVFDRYRIQDAEADGATVPILYEPRMAELHVEGRTIDQLFDRMFATYSREERERIKARYATKSALAETRERLRAIALDLVQHYEERIRPNGFKAQVVAVSREAAVAYGEILRDLLPEGLECAVVITVAPGDPARLQPHRRSADEEQKLIERFKTPGDPLALLIVCDKLLTGFDAPVEQVMYLDKGPVEHDLLQTIARVNRTAAGKTYGLIVDYWGVSENLQEALGLKSGEELFDPADISNVGEVLRPLSDRLRDLGAARRAALRFFAGLPRTDVEEWVARLEATTARIEFQLAFRSFARAMDEVLPQPEALPYAEDLKWLGLVHLAARRRLRDDSLDLNACGAKACKLISDYVRAEGVTNLLEAPVSVFSEKFDAYVRTLGSPEAQASEMKHALTHEISVRADENPVLYRSLRERLEEVIRATREERLQAVEQLRRLQGVAQELRAATRLAGELGFSDERAYAFYRLLDDHSASAAGGAVAEDQSSYDASRSSSIDGSRRELAEEILRTLEELAVIDWTTKDDVQRLMRRRIKEKLRATGYQLDELEPLTLRLMELARHRLGQ
jgi:type I restriction enzyme R subunit